MESRYNEPRGEMKKVCFLETLVRVKRGGRISVRGGSLYRDSTVVNYFIIRFIFLKFMI